MPNPETPSGDALQCPVCEAPFARAGGARCAQCGADLDLLLRVEDVRRELEIARTVERAAAVEQENRRKHFRMLLWVLPLAAFLAGAALTFAWGVDSGVAPSAPSATAAAIRERLAAHPGTSGLRLDVQQTGSALAIAGEVPSEIHRHLVAEVVEGFAPSGGPVRVSLDGVRISSPAPEPPRPAGVAYRIQRGDSLWRIASREYGTPRVWPEILAANRDRLGDSPALTVGDEIWLPEIPLSPGRAFPAAYPEEH